MNWKCLPVVLLTGTILALGATATPAQDACAPCAPPAPMVKKVLVTEYVPQEYETTMKVCQTYTKEERYTAYRCEYYPVVKNRTITCYQMVPKVVNTEKTCYEWYPVVEERVVNRCEYVTEEVWREVTTYVAECVPVTTYVNQCVDKGGHYECREVGGYTSSCSGYRGLCHRHDCGSGCAPCTSVVSVYVPNLVTMKVPYTTYQTVCKPVVTKVKTVVCKPVLRPETIKVTVCKLREVKVPYQATIYECVPYTKEVQYTSCEARMVPYEAVALKCYTKWVDVPVKACRYVARTVEKEVVVYAPSSTDYCGGGCGSYCSESCGHRGLFRRCR